MLKVMHVLNTGKYSGAENVAITIINSLKGEVNATYVSLEGSIKEYLVENDIDYFPVKQIKVSYIRKAIQDIQPDIIHAHDFTTGIICTATGTKIPIINHIHNNSPWIKHYNLRSIVYALSCNRYKKILTVSDSVMNEYVFGKIFKGKTEVIGNPIDIERLKKLAGNNIDKIYDIAFLGRLSQPKNPNFFIDIIEAVKEKKPDICVIMIGEGELREEIEKRIDEGLRENFNLVGFQKNPYLFLKQAKLLLMPSSWEGYGLAAVEALALGIPVVCSGVGGLPGIVNDSCGFICSNIDEYVSSILHILMDKKLYEKLSCGAYFQADKMCNINAYKNTILNIYKELVE